MAHDLTQPPLSLPPLPLQGRQPGPCSSKLAQASPQPRYWGEAGGDGQSSWHREQVNYRRVLLYLKFSPPVPRCSPSALTPPSASPLQWRTPPSASILLRRPQPSASFILRRTQPSASPLLWRTRPSASPLLRRTRPSASFLLRRTLPSASYTLRRTRLQPETVSRAPRATVSSAAQPSTRLSRPDSASRFVWGLDSPLQVC